MNAVVVLNIGALVAYAAAAGIAAVSLRKKTAHYSSVIFSIILLSIPLFVCISNILEHMNITNRLDEYEGFARDLFALFLLLFLYLDSIHRELDFRKRNEQKIQNALEEKTLLLKEIHHRVKNNLQLISSMLSLQCEKQDNEKLTDFITVAKNRILSMAAVHEIIYVSHDLSHLAAHEFINSIILNLVMLHEPCKRNIVIHKSLDTSVFLNVDIAIPVGLIVNELLSNALKYAFATSSPGEISVVMSFTNGMLNLTIEDNGSGMETGNIQNSQNGIGMVLVHSMVEQINGTITVTLTEGTRVSIQIPRTELSPEQP